MAMDIAIVTFHGQPAAASAFSVLRARARNAAWTHEAALVEHHGHKDQLSLHGTVAGHYVSLDESDHLSQPGAAKGAVAGGVLGTAPRRAVRPRAGARARRAGRRRGGRRTRPRRASGRSASSCAPPSRRARRRSSCSPTPRTRTSSWRWSADGEAQVTRRTLTAEELAAIEAAVAAAPAASAGPSRDGDAHSDGEITAA